MKKTILTLAALLLVVFAACQKDDIAPVQPNNPDTPTTVERRAAYLGTYDMVYVTDTFGVDNDWYVNGFEGQYYEDDYGYFVISADPADTASVKVDGFWVISNKGAADTFYFYDTRATFDAQNRLVPEDCEFTANGYTFHHTLGPIRLTDEGIRLRIEQHVPLMGMDCGYILSAIGTRRQ